MSVKLADLLDLEDGEGVEVASSSAPRPEPSWGLGGGSTKAAAASVGKPGDCQIFVLRSFLLGEQGIFPPIRCRFGYKVLGLGVCWSWGPIELLLMPSGSPQAFAPSSGTGRRSVTWQQGGYLQYIELQHVFSTAFFFGVMIFAAFPKP